jgi:hypothetical protein
MGGDAFCADAWSTSSAQHLPSKAAAALLGCKTPSEQKENDLQALTVRCLAAVCKTTESKSLGGCSKPERAIETVTSACGYCFGSLML